MGAGYGFTVIISNPAIFRQILFYDYGRVYNFKAKGTALNLKAGQTIRMKQVFASDVTAYGFDLIKVSTT